MKIPALDLKQHPLTGVSLIEASAGTGKTYTITHLYVRCLLETEIEVQQLLVVTFTNAATQELKGRIRDLIQDVWTYLNNSNIKDNELQVLFDIYRQDQVALLKLQKALINFDEAAIYSIHGFCQRLLNSFPLDTHSLLEQKIVADEQELKQAAVLDFWRKEIVGLELEKLRWIHSFWKDPFKLLHACGPLMGLKQNLKQSQLVAAQSVKDESIFQAWYQIQSLWVTGKEDLIAVIYKNPAFNGNKVRPATVQKLICELDDIFAQSVPYHLPAKWELITTQKLSQCFKSGQNDDRIYTEFFKFSEKFAPVHANWLENQKLTVLLSATQFIQDHIKQIKKKSMNVSFDDLIHQVSDVLKDDDGSLAGKINRAFPMAMVDEFQDTDHKQYAIFKALYQVQSNDEIEQGLILIGDPKQAIYSFRGADVFTYQQARQSTDRQFTLGTNYRSSADYINLINRLFCYNPNAFIYQQLISFHASHASNKQKAITDNGKMASPLVTWLYPFSAEPVSKGVAQDYFSSLCAHEIRQILTGNKLQIDGKPVQASDLAILVKKGSQASLMKMKLAQLGISSALISRDSVFSTEQAREITLLLEVLIDPANMKRLFGLLSSDLFGWDARSIHDLQSDSNRLVQLLEQVKNYQKHWFEKGILSMFFCLIEEQRTLQKNIRNMEGERRMTNWLHIAELLQNQSSQHASASQALHWLKSQREQYKKQSNEVHQLRLESDRNLVRIVTIHKSKGLEYPIVFLPFMWDAKDARNEPKSYSVHDAEGKKQVIILSESERSKWREENLAEEIRLFYVAMTRAKYRCYLGWGNIRQAGGSAIAHCLYQDLLDKNTYPHTLNVTDLDTLRRPFKELSQQDGLVKLIEHHELTRQPVSDKKETVKKLVAKQFTRHIVQQWRISSYSQIATSAHDDAVDRPDHDAVERLSIENIEIYSAEVLDRFKFEKGARAGNFLHDLLEHQPFDKKIDNNLLKQKVHEYGYDEIWIPCLSEWLTDILHSDLNGLKLAELKSSKKISEMEFYMKCDRLQADKLNGLLHQYNYSLAQQFFSFSMINGFLKGFIDLVFEHNGQYFVTDYKSNFLGTVALHYSFEACEQAMFEHHYQLQYLIYTLALHRFLKQRLVGYDYDKHVGGVYYLFLRGLSASSSAHHGVYFHKPPREVIESLNDLFYGK